MDHVMINCAIVIPESQMLPSQKSLLPTAVQWESPRLQLELLRSTSTCENKRASVSLSKSGVGYI